MEDLRCRVIDSSQILFRHRFIGKGGSGVFVNFVAWESPEHFMGAITVLNSNPS
jgi:hypothetical protein